jgi:hypothetical protein
MVALTANTLCELLVCGRRWRLQIGVTLRISHNHKPLGLTFKQRYVLRLRDFDRIGWDAVAVDSADVEAACQS